MAHFRPYGYILLVITQKEDMLISHWLAQTMRIKTVQKQVKFPLKTNKEIIRCGVQLVSEHLGFSHQWYEAKLMEMDSQADISITRD